MLFLVIASILLTSVNAKIYSDCGSSAAVDNVSVSGCKPTAKECILKKDTNVSITIEFTPNTDVTNIESEVHGIIMNLPVPFPLPQPDACKDSGLTCPLQANHKATYEASLSVLKSYPQIRVHVKWELKADGKDLICILIPARIQ